MDATGVLGCLTADQEARLQQLWMFLLNAFEIQEFSDSNVAMSGMSRRSSSINDGAPLSPSSINTTPPSSSRRSMSLSSNHNFYNFSNPFANTVPNTPLTPAFPPTSPTSNSENDNPKPKYQRSLRRLRRRTSLASNGETKPSNEKFPTEPSTPSILRRASTRAGSLAFQTQSMGGINLRPSLQNAKVMQRVLASHKITPDELRMGLLASLKQDHPDAMLLRFLRARKWDVGKAFVMLVAAVAWRTKTMHVDDDILPRGEIHAVQKIRDGNIKEQKDSWDFLNQFRMGKNIIHGVDKAGRPIIDIRVRLHRAEDQSVEMLERYIVHTIESVKMLLRPPLVETAILIFDMTDFSMANMDYTPVKYIIKCMENFYPESLAAIILHKAPWFFSGIWKMIKTWMNDSLVSKVHFTKTLEDLELFIPRSNIPPDLGGTDDKYEYHYIEPDVHDRAENLSLDVHSPTREFLSNQRQQIAEDLLDATRLWLQTSAMRDGIGSAVQQDRRATLIEELRLNFWKLDPFLRARCQLDREGVIVSDGIGTIDFYPHVSAAARRGTDVSMEEGQAVTATSPLPKTSPRNSQGKAGLGLISPSSSTLGEHAEKDGQVEQVERVADLKAEPRTPSSLNFLDDARICMDDEHDYHDESSPTRDEIMQEYMDDDEEEDHPLQHPHTVDYKEKPEYHPHAVQPIAADMHLSAAQKESDMHSVVSFDIDDLDEEDDEEIEIHDAITQRIPYPRGGGIVERAAIRVINVR